MSGPGRRAVVPPADHTRPERTSHDGLIVHHYNRHNRVKTYDFGDLPVAEPMQRSLATLFAAKCTPNQWGAHQTSKGYWHRIGQFAKFVSQQERPPADLDELTGALLKGWWASLPNISGYATFTCVAALLRGDPRLQTGPVAEELARRRRGPKSTVRSYPEAEFEQVKAVARKQFRAALRRIDDNAEHLDAWRAAALVEGSREWLLGEALDILARTGDLPRYRDGLVVKRYRLVLGGMRAQVTWQRLFLTRMEATALGVLLMARYSWNLSVIDAAEVPRALPDAGHDGHPTYRIPIEKYRRGAGHVYETRNVTDDGPASQGRLITQALQATRFARAIVEDQAPGTDRLIVWRTGMAGRPFSEHDRQPPVGLFNFGISRDYAVDWASEHNLGGSPFRRGRRTVVAVDQRAPAQHSQRTHDRDYVLVDKRVQGEAVEVIAAGAQDAADRARKAVLEARLRDEPTPGDVETATADCSDSGNSPQPAPDGGCGASFLVCLGCKNARVHPGHHPRLVHLHHGLTNLRTALPEPVWDADWGDAHARLEDLKHKLGDGPWRHAMTKITDADRDLIDLLLTGNLDT